MGQKRDGKWLSRRAETFVDVDHPVARCPYCGNTGSTEPGSSAFEYRIVLGEPKVRMCRSCERGFWLYSATGQTEAMSDVAWAGIEKLHETLGGGAYVDAVRASEEEATDAAGAADAVGVHKGNLAPIQAPQIPGASPQQALAAAYYMSVAQRTGEKVEPSEIVNKRIDAGSSESSFLLAFTIATESGVRTRMRYEIHEDGRARPVYDRADKNDWERYGRKFLKIRRGLWTDEKGWRPAISEDALLSVLSGQ